MVKKLKYYHLKVKALSLFRLCAKCSPDPRLKSRTDGKVNQWDFCGSRSPGRGRAGRAAILKVVLELMELRRRDKSPAGRSEVESWIVLIREVRM